MCVEDGGRPARLGNHRDIENTLGDLDGEKRNELHLHVSHCYLGLVSHTDKPHPNKYWQVAYFLQTSVSPSVKWRQLQRGVVSSKWCHACKLHGAKLGS